MSNKELVIQAVRNLPEDVSLEKIQEEIEILVAVQQGRQAVQEGRVVPHAEIVKELDSWSTT
jgi:predicted transcriptional regulator